MPCRREAATSGSNSETELTSRLREPTLLPRVHQQFSKGEIAMRGSRLFVCFVLLLVCAVPLTAATTPSSAHGQTQFASVNGTAPIRFTVRQDSVSGDTTGHIDYSDDAVTFSADVNCAVFGVNQDRKSTRLNSSH